jgi:hypothetical protein
VKDLAKGGIFYGWVIVLISFLTLVLVMVLAGFDRLHLDGRPAPRPIWISGTGVIGYPHCVEVIMQHLRATAGAE